MNRSKANTLKPKMKTTDTHQQPWNVWIFVLCLNIVAIGGAIYLKSNGIDLYSFRGGS